ncbi:putative RNase III domain protein [Trypanosoma theileri]|uniref:Putative RNase III domain protein n=1 Tax=Trypanosoma theileri TaxID=67003 RepID=A0A1X0NX52_9TRYP|nr:putative RNase III domain protein [Trypanosoma theileri]ORC89275.1 putative RNase III domain protein [Trypanosoma theileri]
MEGDCGVLELSSECLATLITHPGEGTVSEVLCAWFPSESSLLDDLRKVQNLIASEQLQSLLRHSAPHASELRNRDGLPMASLVGEKTTKALASEYAYIFCPTGDTAKLTNVTRVLISSEFFDPALMHYLGPALSHRKPFMSFLALVVWAGGIRLASSILLPLFKFALEGGKYAIDMPAVLCSLRPGMEFSKLGPDELISLILGELEKRHVYVKKNLDGTNGADKTERYTISVHYGDKQELCKEGVSLRDYYRIVVEEGKKLQNDIHRVRSMKGESYSQPNWKMWMHDIRAILRFRAPYKDLFECGFLDKVTSCNCWVPLREIRCLLSRNRKATYGEPPSEEELQELLEQHDHFQRFQVGVCEVVDSPFSGQLCARALYAHSVTEPLYERTFSAFEEVEKTDACPVHAWFPVANQKEIQKIVRDESYMLYQTAFFSVFSSASLSEFDKYRRRTPLDEQYDEKLSGTSPVFFLEFCLHAAVRSEQMKVLEVPLRGGCGAQWKVFPRRHGNPEDGTPSVDAYYFTGRVATLECPSVGEDSHAFSQEDKFDPKISLFLPLAHLEPRKFTPEERQRIFRNDRDAGNDDKVDTSWGVESSFESVTVDVKQIRLNMEAAERQVLDLVEDPSAWSTLVSFPKKNDSGIGYYNRQNDIKAFKKWIVSLGLLLERYRGTAGTGDNLDHTDCVGEEIEVYEIRKRCKWTFEEVQSIAEELKLTDVVELRLLQQALTRECECENTALSYEILEFIGDAMLDFLVSFDSFLLGKPWNNQVCTQVCCNEVLARLLPHRVSAKLGNCYKDLPYKVKADMVEAIVGAVYRSKKGLDAVRGLLRCLFANLLTNIANTPDVECERDPIRIAMGACPYLDARSETLEQLYRFNCLSLIDEDIAVEYACCVPQFDCGKQSHSALTPFSRIQDKPFATHFTTGVAYSYRHITSIDAPALFNRILSTFGRKSIAFVNEIITEDTHLVIDFDGRDVFQLGILNLIYNWFKDRYRSKSSLLLLNCSGKSVVTGKIKKSYHIHFPQAVIRLSDLQDRMKDMRRYILQHLNHNTLIGDIVGFTYGNAETTRNTIIGQVVFTTDYVAQELNIMGGSAAKRIWEFMDARSLMKMAATCKLLRESVFSYLAYISKDLGTLASVFEVSREFIITSEDNSNDPYLVVRALWHSEDTPHGPNKLFLLPKESVSIIKEDSGEIKDAGMRKVGDKVLTVKEFYNDCVTTQRQNSLFTYAFWKRVIDDALAESKKLRMYLNDKYDMKYGQEYRPLFLDTVIRPGGEACQVMRNTTVQCFNVAPGEESQGDHITNDGKCEIAHASMLRLLALRCPEYRDVHGLLRSAWTDRNNANETLCGLGGLTGRDDRLPSFAAYPSRVAAPCDNWELWRGGVAELDTGAGKTGALVPLYWTHSPPRAHVGGAVVLSAGGSPSLLDALNPATGGTGMTAMARLFTPSVTVANDEVQAAWLTSYAENVLPLFLVLRKSRRGRADGRA